MKPLDPMDPAFEEKFFTLHGANVFDGKHDVRYFIDGARIVGTGQFATFHEAPTDPIAIQEGVIAYWRTRKSHADIRYVELKQSLTYDPATLRVQNGGRLPAPPDEKDLDTLRGYVDDCRAINLQLAEAEKELKRLRDDVDPNVSSLDQMLAERHKKFCDAVRKIKV